MPIHSPPRLLTGITLLFWGGLTGNTLYGLIAAFLVEARSWIPLRWNFTRTSYVRAWHLSVLAALLVSVIAWLNGMKIGKIHTLFVWAPLTLLPVQLAQSYGKAKRIPLNTFSFFARRKMNHELEHGQQINPRMIHLGYPYLAIVLLATAVAASSNISHFVGVLIILGACLLFNAKQHGFRPVAWLCAFIVLAISAYFSQWAIYKAYQHYGHGMSKHNSRFTSANESRTSIGRLGKLKLSPHIFWRAQAVDGAQIPPLLRTATYHLYTRGVWKHIPGPLDLSGFRDKDGYTSEARLKGINVQHNIRYFTKEAEGEEPEISGGPDLKIIGEVDSSVSANPIPLPHFTLGVGDLGDDTSEASLECNTLGTVRIINPDYHIVSYSVWTGDHSTTEVDAPAKYDLEVPTPERPAIKRICAQIGIEKGMSAQQIIARLRRFYTTEFTYTTHLISPKLRKEDRWTAIGTFLEQTRSGHCEYFATATALILRECGIPSRYCVGFAINEYDDNRKEWVMRGKHSHAWCRVWVGNQWVDADLTPPSWLDLEQTDTTSWRIRLADWWQLLREDFLIWRTNTANKLMTGIVVGTIVGVLFLFLIWKLWKSRQHNTSKSKKTSYMLPASAPQTPLNQLEPAISRKIGRRPHGLPLCRWIMQLEKIDPSLNNVLKPLTKIHSELRFDPDAKKELSSEASELAIELKKRLKKLTVLPR